MFKWFQKKPVPNVFILDSSYPIKVFYENYPQDTVSQSYILQLVRQIEITFRHIPDFFGSVEIEIWNSHRPDCKHRGLTYNSKKGKIIITTAYVESLSSMLHPWATAVMEIMAYTLLHNSRFLKNKLLLKKWLALRVGANKNNPTKTFVDDFIFLFARVYARPDSHSIPADVILGLRHFYMLATSIDSLLRWKLLFYTSFLNIPNMDYLGFLFFHYDFNLRSFRFQKITGQGIWSYEVATDQWELTSKF